MENPSCFRVWSKEVLLCYHHGVIPHLIQMGIRYKDVMFKSNGFYICFSILPWLGQVQWKRKTTNMISRGDPGAVHWSNWAGLAASVTSTTTKLRRYLASLNEWQRNIVSVWSLQSTSRTLMIRHKLLGALTVLQSSFLTPVEYLTPQRVWQ